MALLDRQKASRCFYPQCHSEFSTLTELENHNTRAHPLIILNTCPVCQQSFASEAEICNHYRAAHPPMADPQMPGVITCPYPGCQDLFNNRNDFYRHWAFRRHPVYRLAETHRNRFRCVFDFCRATFTTEALIKLHHLLVHTVDQTVDPAVGPSNPTNRPDHFLTSRRPSQPKHSTPTAHSYGRKLSTAGNSDSHNPASSASKSQPSTLTGNNGFQNGLFPTGHWSKPAEIQDLTFPAGHQRNPIEIDEDKTMSTGDEGKQALHPVSLVRHGQPPPAGEYVPSNFPSEEYGLRIFKLFLESQGLIPILTPHEAMDLWNFLLGEEERRSVVATLLCVPVRDDHIQTLQAIQGTFLTQMIEDWINLKLLARKLSIHGPGRRIDSVEGTMWTVLGYCFQLEDLREHRMMPAASVDENVPSRLWRPKTGREVTQYSGFHKLFGALADRAMCRKALPSSLQFMNTMVPLNVMAYVSELQEVTAYLYPRLEDVHNWELWNSFSDRSSRLKMQAGRDPWYLSFKVSSG